MIASLTLLATFILLGLPAAIVFIPLAVLTGNATPLYRVSMRITRTAFFLAGIRIAVSGRDPPALLPLIPGRAAVFLKRSLTRIPILGYAFKLGEFIPVDRDGRVESAQESAAAARRVLGKGIHIATFVEGTRSRDGRLLPFKKGPFYLAKDAGAPCIPVSIHGTESMMAKGSLKIRPGAVHIVFHPPIDPAQYQTREELMQAVRAAIASALPEWMRT
jgi:1-acyl-sn-glycerol-3-phosphate acyltransferase